MTVNAQGVFTWTDHDFTYGQVLTPAYLNRIRSDIKAAFDVKKDIPDKPWYKGNLQWYDGAEWSTLETGTLNQVLVMGLGSTPDWKTLVVSGSDLFEYTGTAADGDILWYNGTNWVLLNKGTNNQVLSLNSSRELYWRTISEGFSYTGTVVRGDILYYGSGSQWHLLNKGSSGQILEQGSNDPHWVNKPSDSNKIALHVAKGTIVANNTYTHREVYDADDLLTQISGTHFRPFSSGDRYLELGSLTFTPNSTTSKILVTAIVNGGDTYSGTAGSGAGIGFIPFLILDSNAVNYSNIVGDNITLFPLDLYNDTWNGTLKYNYTITNNNSKTIKLYVGVNDFGRSYIGNSHITEDFNINMWYIEAMEIY